MSPRKLLLADDSATIRKVVELTFADEGMEVITTADGDSALNAIASERPDIVLADVHMPGMNGYELCSAVREHPDFRSLPVVLLVGSFEPFDEGEAARVGASSHITKPFQSIRDLIIQVSALMGSNEVHADSIHGAATADMDRLHAQSFAETVEIVQPTADLADRGMDDEMIEAATPEQLRETEGAAFAEQYDGSTIRDMDAVYAFSSDAPAARESAMAMPATTVYPEPSFDPPAAEHHEGARPDADPFEETVSIEFNESELLELPSAAEEETVELRLPGEAAPGTAAAAVSLSPALMDEIVRRVLEALRDKN